MPLPLSSYLAAHPGPDDAAVAELVNADPAYWLPVPSHRVLAWIGEAGRLTKLRAIVAADAGTPGAVVVRDAVETVLLAVNNPNAVVDVSPASPHRQLLAAIVAGGGLTQDDADALVARGRPDGWVDVTAADVAAARAALARDAAFAAARSAEDADHLRRVGLIDEAQRSGGDAPTLADLNAGAA